MRVFIKNNFFLFEKRLGFADWLPKLPAEVFVSAEDGITAVRETNKNPL